MIVYDKLANILRERNMQWKDLCNGGLSVNTPTKFSQNRTMNTDNINKVCTFLQVQPSEIMEWIPDNEYEIRKQNAKQEERQNIEAQIAELQAKLKEI